MYALRRVPQAFPGAKMSPLPRGPLSSTPQRGIDRRFVFVLFYHPNMFSPRISLAGPVPESYLLVCVCIALDEGKSCGSVAAQKRWCAVPLDRSRPTLIDCSVPRRARAARKPTRTHPCCLTRSFSAVSRALLNQPTMHRLLIVLGAQASGPFCLCPCLSPSTSLSRERENLHI